jgi:hypothetical protein
MEREGTQTHLMKTVIIVSALQEKRLIKSAEVNPGPLAVHDLPSFELVVGKRGCSMRVKGKLVAYRKKQDQSRIERRGRRGTERGGMRGYEAKENAPIRIASPTRNHAV